MLKPTPRLNFSSRFTWYNGSSRSRTCENWCPRFVSVSLNEELNICFVFMEEFEQSMVSTLCVTVYTHHQTTSTLVKKFAYSFLTMNFWKLNRILSNRTFRPVEQHIYLSLINMLCSFSWCNRFEYTNDVERQQSLSSRTTWYEICRVQEKEMKLYCVRRDYVWVRCSYLSKRE